jgi:hypothetical protein
MSGQCGILNILQPYRTPGPVTGIALMNLRRDEKNKCSSSLPFVLHFAPISSSSTSSPRLCEGFRNEFVFYGEELLAPRQTPKLEDHPLSFVRGCLFNIFPVNLQSCRPSIPSATRGRIILLWQGNPLTWGPNRVLKIVLEFNDGLDFV